MKRYTKNGKIILDGTTPKYEKEKLAFEKLSLIEDLEEKLGIDLIDIINKLLK